MELQNFKVTPFEVFPLYLLTYSFDEGIRKEGQLSAEGLLSLVRYP
jgi:hypothetical protein